MEPEATPLWATYFETRSNEARNAIYEHYHAHALDTALRWAARFRLPDADDAAGECLMLLLTRLIPAYDGKRPFASLVNVAFRNRCCNVAITLRRRERNLDNPQALQQPQRTNAAKEALRDAIAKLPHTQRLCVRLRLAFGRKAARTAEIFGLNIREFRASYRDAVGQLRLIFAKL